MSDRDEKAGPSDEPSALDALGEKLEALDKVLKEPAVGAALAERGLNVSMVLTAIAGIRLYLEGDKLGAVEDFETVAEEVRAREAMRIGGGPHN